MSVAWISAAVWQLTQQSQKQAQILSKFKLPAKTKFLLAPTYEVLAIAAVNPELLSCLLPQQKCGDWVAEARQQAIDQAALAKVPCIRASEARNAEESTQARDGVTAAGVGQDGVGPIP